MKRKHPLSKPGFTVLELLLVVVLMAVTAAVAYPFLFEPVRRRAVSSAAWTVATALEQARSRGLMEMLVPIATFTHGSGRFEVGSQGYLLDNDCRVTWAGGTPGSTLGLEFGSKGELTSYSLPQSLKVVAPQLGGMATVNIATTGYITWAAGD